MNQNGNPAGREFVGGAGMKSTLLVIGGETSFSPLLADYSLGLAKRMGYSILAVNLLEADKRKIHYLKGESGKSEMENFHRAASMSASEFGIMAKAEGAPFRADCAVGRLDDIAREISEREGNIDLILVEPDYLFEEDQEHLSIPAFIFSGSGQR